MSIFFEYSIWFGMSILTKGQNILSSGKELKASASIFSSPPSYYKQSCSNLNRTKKKSSFNDLDDLDVHHFRCRKYFFVAIINEQWKIKKAS